MKKISPAKAVELSKKLNRFTYFSNPFVLHSNCLLEIKNGEEIIIDTETGLKNPFFLPQKLENIASYNKISCAFDEDIEKLERLGFKITKKELYGLEYIYQTEDFIKMEGKRFREVRKDVSKFKKLYKFKILHKYPEKKILEFMKFWKENKNLENMPEEAREIFNLDYKESVDYVKIMDKLPNKATFIEVDKKLVGFAIDLKLHDNLRVNLMCKVNIKYDGITRFFYNLRAIQMSDIKYFTTGTEGKAPGLEKFKESLHPVKKIPLYEIDYTKE
jgi:hypothetical protein